MPMRGPVVGGNEKGPVPFGIRACRDAVRGGCAALCASLARMKAILLPLEAWQAGDVGAIADGVAGAPRSHRSGTCERDLTLQGSGGSDGAAHVHDETFRIELEAPRSEEPAL